MKRKLKLAALPALAAGILATAVVGFPGEAEARILCGDNPYQVAVPSSELGLAINRWYLAKSQAAGIFHDIRKAKSEASQNGMAQAALEFAEGSGPVTIEDVQGFLTNFRTQVREREEAGKMEQMTTELRGVETKIQGIEASIEALRPDLMPRVQAYFAAGKVLTGYRDLLPFMAKDVDYKMEDRVHFYPC